MVWLRPHVADDALAAGPWCWPRDGERLDALVARRGERPEPGVGSIAALTVQDETVVLWHVARGRPGGSGATLGRSLRASWRDAAIALPRALPVLWSSMQTAMAATPTISYLASVRSAPGMPDLRSPIDGPSFGLALTLSLASIVFDATLPGDVVASATVDGSGNVGPVGGLGQKIGGLQRMAPRVTRLIVAASQRDEAELHAGPHLRVVPVTHAAEAIDIVFADRLSQVIVAAGENPQRRDQLTESFFRLAVVGSDSLVDWAPVMRGARLALDRWNELAPEARYRLEFAHAVAARHHDNSGRAGMPPEGWLQSLPRPLRVQVVAHLVQQSADAGHPEPERVEALGNRLLDHALEDSSPADLRLRGALARLHAVTGRALAALLAQEALARAFAAIYADSDLAYPLSEWARLAGALSEPTSLARAQEFHARLLGTGGYRGLGPRFVELAIARGRLLLDPADPEARDLARQLAMDEALPDHVRWCASRWLGAEGRSALTAEASRGHRLASRNLVLADLDEALRMGDDIAANAAVDALQGYDPGPVAHLRRCGATTADIARLYPY